MAPLCPRSGVLTSFGELLEQATVEYFRPSSPVKSFEKGVLGGHAGLDEIQVYLMRLGKPRLTHKKPSLDDRNYAGELQLSMVQILGRLTLAG
ncbi:MAG: hypothetical protein HOH43_21595 [Candidatus Latescibacteria bacterium]|nr:hypothetical protein [Candidatus Latescibacterota bacterium]